MSSTTLIVLLELQNGQETSPVTFIPAGERTSLRLTAQQVGTSRSQARLTVLDEFGRVKGTLRLSSEGSTAARQKIIVLEALEGNLTARVECLAGTCLVSLEELDGADGVVPRGTVDATDLDPAAWKTLSAIGVDSSAGDANLTVPGVAVGDRVALAFRAPTAGGALVAVDKDLELDPVAHAIATIVQRQAAGNLTTATLVFLVLPSNQ